LYVGSLLLKTKTLWIQLLLLTAGSSFTITTVIFIQTQTIVFNLFI
jgi:hypothetical protein